jgi:hypothetical protein
MLAIAPYGLGGPVLNSTGKGARVAIPLSASAVRQFSTTSTRIKGARCISFRNRDSPDEVAPQNTDTCPL